MLQGTEVVKRSSFDFPRCSLSDMSFIISASLYVSGECFQSEIDVARAIIKRTRWLLFMRCAWLCTCDNVCTMQPRGCKPEILAGREIPHATVIAFSRGGGGGDTPQRRRQRSPSRIDLSTDSRDLFRFLDPFCSVRCANRRLYACIDTILPVSPSYQNHRPSTELIYHLVEPCVSVYKRYFVRFILVRADIVGLYEIHRFVFSFRDLISDLSRKKM